ncbi:MAG: 2-C-methyl-D-erythritol 4-phosphate cytidylyltransferase [Quinella sp. 1Q5]|nr:2-C-methyl-D-erythritol 4-phosphate cytidylyltransferase [Quinella sp. 1Q5]
MVTAVFPAAGSSKRMGGGVNKNLLELAGEPILLRTLKTFSKVERINFLIVVVAAHEVETVEGLMRSARGLKPWRVTVGGSERQYSIANGLKLLPDDAQIVLVHDAARPLVTVQTINEVIDAAEQFGGAIAAIPEKNTIKVIDAQGFVKYTPPRAELVSVMTPQGFRREILLRAYDKAAEENFLGTDDSSLVEQLGFRVKVVAGGYQNIKITTPEDIRIAETFLEESK